MGSEARILQKVVAVIERVKRDVLVPSLEAHEGATLDASMDDAAAGMPRTGEGGLSGHPMLVVEVA